MTNKRLALALVAVGISLYSIHVDRKFAEDADATSMCDIAAWSTCKGAFQSEYGTGFGIICSVTGEDHWLCQKNSVYGVFFYSSMLPLTLMRNTAAAEVLVLMSLSSIIVSTYLTVILIQLRNLCLVCAITHIVNILLLIQNWRARRQIMAEVYADVAKKDQ